MGYDLHITRKQFSADPDGPAITAEEWLAYVATDPQMHLLPDRKDHMVRLDVSSKYPDPWLAWFDGNIYSKNPDEAILAKMLQVASALSAKVRGDDDEIYRSANLEDTYRDD